MIFMFRLSLRIVPLFAILFSANVPAAVVTLQPDQSLTVGLGTTSSQRVAVDVSTNLLNWTEITNVVADSILKVLMPESADAAPAQFFRLADADATVAVRGFIDGGPLFGPVGGAQVAANGFVVTSDANGFFNFNARFFRDALPLAINVVDGGAILGSRTVHRSDAGALAVIPMHLGAPTVPTIRDGSIFRFKVESGPRVGEEFQLTFTNSGFKAEGAVTGEGSVSVLGTTPPSLWLRFDSNPSIVNEIYF